MVVLFLVPDGSTIAAVGKSSREVFLPVDFAVIAVHRMIRISKLAFTVKAETVESCILPEI